MIINELALMLCVGLCVCGAVESERNKHLPALIVFGIFAALFTYQFFINLKFLP